ncbi:glycerol-3-phosphate transporter ATP-binding subunit [compost metagenome]
MIVGLRPEHIDLATPDEGVLSAQVALVESTGATCFLTMATTPELSVVFNGRSAARAGDRVGLNFAPGSIHLFDAHTERCLSD